MEAFSAFVHDALQEWRVPGAAVAIVKDTDVVFVEGFGLRNIAEGLPVTPTTVFGIASCTKPFTTLLMSMLVEDGALAWDVPVRAYLPAFTMYDPVATDRLTPRDLVTHRSGLPPHTLFWYNSPLTPKDVVERLPFLEPNIDFRARYQYSNLTYTMAGYVVEYLSGTGWQELVHQRIFAPLAMTHSTCTAPHVHPTGNVALPYWAAQDGPQPLPFQRLDATAPAGAIYASATDLATWLLIYLNHGQHRSGQLISEQSVRDMCTPQMVTPEPAFPPELSHVTCGLGWNNVLFRGHMLFRHGGMSDGFSACVSWMPQERVGVVVLTNMNRTWLQYVITYTAYEQMLGLDQTPWSRRIKASLLQRQAAAGPDHEHKGTNRDIERPRYPLDAYTGVFTHAGYGPITIARDGDQLRARFNDLRVSVRHEHDDRFDFSFKRATGSVTCTGWFSANSHDAISKLAIAMEPTVQPIIFTRTA